MKGYNFMKFYQNCDKKITAEGRIKFCSAECQNIFYNEYKTKSTKKYIAQGIKKK